MSKLKPCPFCGNKNIDIVTFHGMFQVICQWCHIMTEEKETKKEAVDDWNKRAKETKK